MVSLSNHELRTSVDQEPVTEKPTAADSVLARTREEGRARLRVYIGAAPGVGKTFQMLEDAHQLRRQNLDVVVGFVEPHGRADTLAQVRDLEQVPLRRIEYRGVALMEMDVAAIKARHPAIVVVDELAHTNAPGSEHEKRYEDVIELLDAGINVITAVNIQHIESLNDAIAATTGVRVRETVPDWVLKRADEVVNVDVSIETLRTRLRQGKIYDAAKIEQALSNFFRKGNLTALRELALRQLASDQAGKAQEYRAREGLDGAVIPEKVMVAMASRGSAKNLLRVGSRIAGRLATDWFAVYVETPKEEPGRIAPADHAALADNIQFAKHLGAKVVQLKGSRVADALVEFAKREGVTHVIFGQSARSRWDLALHGSIVDRFLRDVRDATVQIVPVRPDHAIDDEGTE
jgi:two-component system, OmpR family, sensor histidine kinase KdpD